MEVGSFDVNGNIRSVLLPRARYIGVDRRKGPNVDRVASGHKLPFKDSTFDAVLCLETLEHDEQFWLTVAECRRVLKKGGRFVVTVPSIGFPKHDQPHDYYRFTVEGVRQMFKGMRKIHVEAVGDYAFAPPGVIVTVAEGIASVFGHAVK